jgi:hypothetical protein
MNNQRITYNLLICFKNEARPFVDVFAVLFAPEYLKNMLWTQFTGSASVAQPGRAAAS